MLYEEREIAVIFVGHMFGEALEVRKQLKEAGYHCSLVNARFVKPLDEEMLSDIGRNHRYIITMEEGILTGGFGESVSHWYQENAPQMPFIRNIALPDKFIEHGSVEMLKKKYKIDAEGIAEKIMDFTGALYQ